MCSILGYTATVFLRLLKNYKIKTSINIYTWDSYMREHWKLKYIIQIIQHMDDKIYAGTSYTTGRE